MSEAPLRLGLIGPVPPPNGGMAMQTAQLARLLRAEGLAVELLATNAPYRPAWAARLPGVRALFRLLPYLLSVWRLAGRVDVIHLMANSGWSWQLFAAPVLWLAPLRGTPVVVNYRGGEARAYFQRSFRWVQPALRRAARVVVPSGYLQSVFADFGVETRVIPNIVDLEVFRPGPPRAYHEPPVLVVTRNLEAIYGLDTALQALALLGQRGVVATLRIAGSGPQEGALRALANSLGVAEQVRFEGRLDRDAIIKLYAGADVMLNPSRVDNMPNSVIEALACGLPVVSTDVGGVPYIVEHGQTALLVPADDPQAMAAAVLRLSREPDLGERLRANGLRQVQTWAWPVVRPQWLSTYRELLA